MEAPVATGFMAELAILGGKSQTDSHCDADLRSIPVSSTRRSAASSSVLGSGSTYASGAIFKSQPVLARISSKLAKVNQPLSSNSLVCEA
jgi:hypothetical protein